MSDYSPISHGKPIDSLRLDEFVLTEALYNAGSRIPRHQHECATITFVLQGDVKEVVERRPEVLGLHEMLLKPAGTTHSNAFGPNGARLLLVEVFSSRLQHTNAADRAFDHVRQVPKRLMTMPLIRVRNEMRRGDEYSALCIEGILLELLGMLARLDDRLNSVPTYLRCVQERLQDDFRAKIRISELARDAGVKPVQLSRTFRAVYGCRIGEYLRRRRLEWAMQALSQTRRPIAHIALEGGFSDQSHFTRQLKAATGLTPAAYRARAPLRG